MLIIVGRPHRCLMALFRQLSNIIVCRHDIFPYLTTFSMVTIVSRAGVISLWSVVPSISNLSLIYNSHLCSLDFYSTMILSLFLIIKKPIFVKTWKHILGYRPFRNKWNRQTDIKKRASACFYRFSTLWKLLNRRCVRRLRLTSKNFIVGKIHSVSTGWFQLRWHYHISFPSSLVQMFFQIFLHSGDGIIVPLYANPFTPFVFVRCLGLVWHVWGVSG